jgi:hypothetical protein
MTYQSRVYIDGRLQKQGKPTASAAPEKVEKKKPVSTRGRREHALLDYLRTQKGYKSDSEIARMLETTPNYVSRIRSGTESFGPKFILILYDKAEMPIDQIRKLLKDKRC